MALHEVTFPSANGRDQIHGWIYAPARPPRAIVQIVHGLGEHSRRYLHLISRLLEEGFVVAADDHAGHGETAVHSGVWMDTGEDGARAVVEDEQTLHDLVAEKFPDLPYFMFGHSWGSMIARGFATAHSDELTGLMLCGVAAQIPGIEEALDRDALDAAIAQNGGTFPGMEYMGQLFAGMVDRYENPRTPSDWIALEPDVVTDHGSDPLNALNDPMSLRFIRDFADLYDAVNGDWAQGIPTALPMLLLSGDQDPVANYGEGVYHVANSLWGHGSRDVRTRVFSGFRHEIHNEPPIRDEVEGEIVDFVVRHL